MKTTSTKSSTRPATTKKGPRPPSLPQVRELDDDDRNRVAVEGVARAVAAFDEMRRSPRLPFSEIAETLDAQDRDLLRAIEILVNTRETIRICVREELTHAAVFSSDAAVTS